MSETDTTPPTAIHDVEPPEQDEHWLRWQNRQVMNRTACLVCGGSIPWSHDFSWKFAAAAGCLEGPFCSRSCYWDWFMG